MRLFARLLTAFAISALTCAVTASADEVTYTYTGNRFNNFGGDATCPLECNMSGSFTVPVPVGPNFHGFFIPDSFSFTDGLVTITQANATSFAFGFITNSLGEITVWNVNAIDPLTSMFTSTGPSLICPVGCTVTDGSFAPSALDTINYAQVKRSRDMVIGDHGDARTFNIGSAQHRYRRSSRQHGVSSLASREIYLERN